MNDTPPIIVLFGDMMREAVTLVTVGVNQANVRRR